MGCFCSKNAKTHYKYRNSPAGNVFTRKESIVKFRRTFREENINCRSFDLHHNNKNNETLEFKIITDAWTKGRGINLHKTFRDSEEEVRIAYEGGISYKRLKNPYSFEKSLCVVLRQYHEMSTKKRQVLSSAILVLHDDVFELLWLATKRKFESRGYGSKLFKLILQLARHAQLKGVMVMANKAAIPFWLNRESKNRCKHVLYHNLPCIVPMNCKIHNNLNSIPKDEEICKLSQYSCSEKKTFHGNEIFRYSIKQAMHIYFSTNNLLN